MKEREFGYVEVDKPEVYRGAHINITMFVGTELDDDIIRHLIHLLNAESVQVVKYRGFQIMNSSSRRLWIYLKEDNKTIKEIMFEDMFPDSYLL